MLWITGSLLLIIWLVMKFLLHKTGMVHLLLLSAIVLFVIQFAQDRRTKEYERDQEGR
jgi:Flp pilus assembly protein TadB